MLQKIYLEIKAHPIVNETSLPLAATTFEQTEDKCGSMLGRCPQYWMLRGSIGKNDSYSSEIGTDNGIIKHHEKFVLVHYFHGPETQKERELIAQDRIDNLAEFCKSCQAHAFDGGRKTK